ncbi:Imm1 family immunity protein [Actinokineospora sp. NBRC 105648]|uniref:Imm1 family immunity protein n=1 Tax=Actinokineospora sp. NBRC 105648 TaxID=3032206 RepID=UPI0024A558FE|nr:Imm1 family immunity protein [Actinokineospora sp. NBRC 105648]GLZ38336.1 hypothetical protein Acsp05_19600 [Actinokineospora sp. NBRC 105648]
MTATPVTDRAYIDLESLPAGVDLVREVRSLNEAGVEVPWMWVITEQAFDIHSKTQVMFVVGVNNAVGVLHWDAARRGDVPKTGTNPEWIGYFLAGSHESPVPPHAEVPIDLVYQALAEFLTTRTRPTCVQWQEAAHPMSQFT